MDELWKLSRLKHRLTILLLVYLLHQNLDFCSCLNPEGLALLKFREGVVSDPFGALSTWNENYEEVNPCSWFGVECADGNVVALNLKDLCLGGTLAPELGNLIHIKSIILRNNTFSGIVPSVIGDLKELEVLDLGNNNFSGALPSNLGSKLSLSILLVDDNVHLVCISHEIQKLHLLSELQADKNQLFNALERPSSTEIANSWIFAKPDGVINRRILAATPLTKKRYYQLRPPIYASPSPSLDAPPVPPPSPTQSSSPSLSPSIDSPPSSSSASPPLVSAPASPTSKKSYTILILSAVIGGSVVLVSIMVIVFCRNNEVATVKPWATGISGQLQKAFVTGVPKLKRTELETACEDFSNVISSSPIGTVYKGTLSNGVEIAVASVTATSSKDWSKNLEAQFRNKIDMLSKINHKNFVNLLGYCEEEEPFTRMMVFEYAPNGTLFEHLHIKEAEHLDWGMRVRIAMGMAYCIEHMHQLTPPMIHKKLDSSSVCITEDYAAKISNFYFGAGSTSKDNLITASPSLESNVYSFGVVLFEMITGRLPYSVDNGSIEDWASYYLRGEKPLEEMVDPTLKSFQLDQLDRIGEVIKMCVHPEPKHRPTMRELTAQLREITLIGPELATPRLSPLWWAELEILSVEAS